MWKIESNYLECICLSPAHTVRICQEITNESGWLDDEDSGIWIEVQLNNYRTILERIVIAVKYIFGINNEGYYDCTSLTFQDLDKLETIIKKARENRRNILNNNAHVINIKSTTPG